MNHKPMSRTYTNLEIARSQHVFKKQKHIKLRAKHNWCDVEADEVDVGKEVDMKKKTARWEQWGGLVEPGHPKTLVLFWLPSRATAVRSPGPGPIAKRDRKPVAKKFLEGRDVILQTDGAKAYKMKITGVLRDSVVHKKKKIVVRGRAVWVKPHLTRTRTHKPPSGE